MKKKYIITSLSIAILLAAGVVYYFTSSNDEPDKLIETDTTSQAQPDTKPATQEPDNTKPAASEGSTDDDKVIVPSVPSDSVDKPETPTITRAEQSGDYVRISAIFQKPSNGECKLTLKNGSQSVEKTAQIIVGPSYYACNGFRIPVSELSDGRWIATLSHVVNGHTSTAEAKTINIKL